VCVYVATCGALLEHEIGNLLHKWGKGTGKKSYDIMRMATKNGTGINQNPAANWPRLPPSHFARQNDRESRQGETSEDLDAGSHGRRGEKGTAGLSDDYEFLYFFWPSYFRHFWGTKAHAFEQGF